MLRTLSDDARSFLSCFSSSTRFGVDFIKWCHGWNCVEYSENLPAEGAARDGRAATWLWWTSFKKGIIKYYIVLCNVIFIVFLWQNLWFLLHVVHHSNSYLSSTPLKIKKGGNIFAPVQLPATATISFLSSRWTLWNIPTLDKERSHAEAPLHACTWVRTSS